MRRKNGAFSSEVKIYEFACALFQAEADQLKLVFICFQNAAAAPDDCS